MALGRPHTCGRTVAARLGEPAMRNCLEGREHLLLDRPAGPVLMLRRAPANLIRRSNRSIPLATEYGRVSPRRGAEVGGEHISSVLHQGNNDPCFVVIGCAVASR
jgi:hypothetical protein